MTATAAASQTLDNVRPLPVAPARRPVNKWLVTLSITFGTLMGAIDASIVTVAIPHIRGAVGATVEEITWISTSFAISMVLVMPLTAFLGAMVGQKRLYLFSLVLFLVGSALCGTAHSLATLVVFRAIQGFGAGALQPTEQAILRQTFPPQEQGMATAVFGMAVMIGPAVGPTLGGFIVDNWSWPWIFFINLPVGILGVVMVTRFVHEADDIRHANRLRAQAQRRFFDWQGIILLTVGLASLQYVLEEGNRDDWFNSPLISACALLALFSLAAFAIRELTAPVPAVNLRLFRDKTFLSGTLVGSAMFAMLMSGSFLLPVFMQELLGFTAMQSGLSLLPRVIVMMVTTPIIGRMYNRVSPRAVVGLGVILFAIGAYQMSHFTLSAGMTDIVIANMIQGLGFSCLFVPLITTALSNIPRPLMTDATGLNSLCRQVGASFGLAIFATLLSRYITTAKNALLAHVSAVSAEALQRLHGMAAAFVHSGLDPSTAGSASYAVLSGTVAREATVLGFEKTFLLCGIAFLCVMPLLYFLKASRAPGLPKAEAHLEL
jgi:DHA2 family multidrug resistance protein